MSDSEGPAIARQLIATEAEQQTGVLDLGRLGLTELPEEIHQLTHLRVLNLGGWLRDENGVPHDSANQLTPNHFIAPSLPPLRFPGLSHLSIAGTSVSDLTPLSGLTRLQSLVCFNTSVSDLTPLSGLTRLQSLHCSGTSVSDLTPLSGLTRLQSLDCAGTSVSDLTPLSRLTRLQSLNCSFTLVSDLTPLSGLTRLQSLDCFNTSVSDLTPLSGLTCLQSLHCADTSVSDLTPLSGLTSLQSLVATRCRLVAFPRGLLEKSPAIRLRLFATQIPDVPPEVLSRYWDDDCRQRLLDHVTDLEAGVEPVTDVKVIVIGNGRIGKTQICNRLRGKAFEPDADSTHGITVTQTKLPQPGDEPPEVLNLWDFGGQDLYHGTHALFLKSRAVFVVVWTPAAESSTEYEHGGMKFRNQPLPYWLDYVRNAAGDVCPVVLVQNQCDTAQDEVRQPPADPAMLDAFPYLQTVHYSAREDRKRDSLNDALRAAIAHLRGREGIATIGRGRMKVRQQLQQWLDEDAPRDRDQRQHRTLTQTQFRALCKKVGDVSSPDSLLDYLHHAGVVFYQKGLFRDEIVLDQSWALDAIYTVFNREQCYRQLAQLGGRFTRSLLEVLVWPSGEYSVAEQKLFLSLMTSCGICFEHRRGDEQRNIEAEYVAPDLLPDRASIAPELAGRWDDSVAHEERAWRFEFLHPGLVRSVISKIGQQAGACAVYWKYGVWFYDATTRASALLAQEMLDDRRGRLVVQTQGDRGRDLLDSVTWWIERTIDRSGDSTVTREFEPPTVGPFPNPRGLSGRREADPACPESSGREDSPAEKIDFADPPRPDNERRACVSYAWKDWKEERSHEPARAGKVDAFCQRLEEGGRQVVRDTTHLPLYGRIGKFMRESIGHSDRVYVFLSDAYLKSPNCASELHEIWRHSGSDGATFCDRIRIFLMPGMVDLRDPEIRLEYADFWEARSVKLEQLIQMKTRRVSDDTFEEYTRIRELPSVLDKMLAQIADVLNSGDLDEFIESALSGD